MKDFVTKSIASDHHLLLCKVDYNSENDLFSLLQKNRINLSRLNSIKNNKRRTEWMTVRALLIEYFKEAIDIVYDSQNKPHLNKSDYHISISHSQERIAISLNKHKDNGIDLQYITPKIERIRHKFLKLHESDQIKELDYETLTYYWSIKEALFKVYGKNDIFLKENIEVIEFNQKPKTAIGVITASNYQKQLNMKCDLIGDYALAYTVNP